MKINDDWHVIIVVWRSSNSNRYVLNECIFDLKKNEQYNQTKVHYFT
jgi:hypothetical protein